MRRRREGGFWARVAGAVMRRPVVSLVASVALLLAAAAPFASINTGFAGVSTLPDSFESKRGFVLLDEEFGYGTAPAEIVIDGEIASPAVQAGIERLETLLASDDAFGRPELAVNDAGDLAVMTVLLGGDAASTEATEGVATLRDDYVPGGLRGVRRPRCSSAARRPRTSTSSTSPTGICRSSSRSCSGSRSCSSRSRSARSSCPRRRS